MAKEVSLVKVKSMVWRLIPNVEIDNGDGSTSYKPWQIKMTCVASGDGAVNPVCVKIDLGALQDNPYTDKELYSIIKNTGTVNTILANNMKEMYLEAISVDLDQ